MSIRESYTIVGNSKYRIAEERCYILHFIFITYERRICFKLLFGLLVLLGLFCLFGSVLGLLGLSLVARKMATLRQKTQLRMRNFATLLQLLHVEYSVQMARVKKNSENFTAHWGSKVLLS